MVPGFESTGSVVVVLGSILKEISPECSLEGLMLKLKLNTLEFVKS